MRIKIKPTDECCQFIIKKEERKVICVIHDTRYLLTNFVIDFDTDMFVDGASHITQMPNQFSGMATCAEGDEWNEELGKRIAFARAKYKLDRSFFRRANNLVNHIDRRLNRLYDEFNDYGAAISRTHDNRIARLEKDLGEDFVLYKNTKKEGDD